MTPTISPGAIANERPASLNGRARCRADAGYPKPTERNSTSGGVTGAGAARPRHSVGGLSEVRPGSVPRTPLPPSQGPSVAGAEEIDEEGRPARSEERRVGKECRSGWRLLQ